MKVTSSFIRESDYLDEEDDSFYEFVNGFRFIFEYEDIFNATIEIRNPFIHSKIKWQEFYNHIDQGKACNLDFGELGYLRYNDNKLEYKVGNNQEFYQFRYAYGNKFDNKCLVIIQLTQCKQDFLVSLKSLLEDQKIARRWK